MTHPQVAIPAREPAANSADDTILPFAVEALELRGRLVRLGPVVDQILRRHDYPKPVAKLVGEAIVLTVLLGSVLKFEGRFILQTKTDGPVKMLVVDYRTPGSIRALASFDKERVAAAIAANKGDARALAGTLLGHGHLAMTIDQGPDTARYQGLVALDGKDLEHAAHEYFLRSEQIPTRVRLAVGEEFVGGGYGWRAGGILLQFIPKSPERARLPDLDPGDAPEGYRSDADDAVDDAWVEGRSLVETVEDVELIDPALSAERLLYRLFHERGVRVFRTRTLGAECSCSRPKVATMLRSFPQDDRDHMIENGVITVTCEFCNSSYVFEPDEVRDPS